MTVSKITKTSVAAVFDVDGTLCSTRSTTGLIWLRARQHSPLKHGIWLASILWRAPMLWLIDKFSRNMVDRIIFKQFKGLSLHITREDAVECCHKLLYPACFSDALEEINMHKRAGRRIILLSGGVDIVLAPLAEILGAELLAQRLENDGTKLTGNYFGYEILDNTDCASGSQALRKMNALKLYAARENIDLSESYAYGDSINDANMLALTGNPIVVNPDRGLRKIACRNRWQFRCWKDLRSGA